MKRVGEFAAMVKAIWYLVVTAGQAIKGETPDREQTWKRAEHVVDFVPFLDAVAESDKP